jgi:hypothetical protein
MKTDTPASVPERFRAEVSQYHVLRVPHVLYHQGHRRVRETDTERRIYVEHLAKRDYLRRYVAFLAPIKEVRFLNAPDMGRWGTETFPLGQHVADQVELSTNMMPASLALCMTMNSMIDDQLREKFAFIPSPQEADGSALRWEGQPISWYVYQSGRTDASFLIPPYDSELLTHRRRFACVFLQKRQPVGLTRPREFFTQLEAIATEGIPWTPCLAGLLNGHVDGFVCLTCDIGKEDKGFPLLCQDFQRQDRMRGFWRTVIPLFAYLTDHPLWWEVENLKLLRTLHDHNSPNPA